MIKHGRGYFRSFQIPFVCVFEISGSFKIFKLLVFFRDQLIKQHFWITVSSSFDGLQCVVNNLHQKQRIDISIVRMPFPARKDVPTVNLKESTNSESHSETSKEHVPSMMPIGLPGSIVTSSIVGKFMFCATTRSSFHGRTTSEISKGLGNTTHVGMIM